MKEPIRTSMILPDSSPEKVFAALSDVERFPEWAFGVKKARRFDASGNVPGAIAPGSAVELTLSAAGFTHRMTSTVTAVEAPRLLEWRYTEGAIGAGIWTIEDLSGAVQLTLHTRYEVKPSWLDHLANRPFFRGIIEDLLMQSMQRFRERLAG